MNRSMKFSSAAFLIFFLLAIPAAMADISIPTKTTVLIEQDGREFTGPVSFNVSCYGYMCKDYDCRPDRAYGERDPHNAAPVFSYSASCPKSGCAIYQPFYTNHRHIAWCDMAGIANGTPFALPNFSENPVPDCTIDFPFDMSTNDTYYRYPPAYRDCQQQKEEEKKNVCGKYITPITWAEIENSTGLSWFASNGTYWVRTDAYLLCTSQLDQESGECGVEYPLEPVDPATLERDPQGNIIGSHCTLRIALPSEGKENISGHALPPDNQTPTEVRLSGTMITPIQEFVDGVLVPENAGLMPGNRSTIESLFCKILSFFGRRCS